MLAVRRIDYTHLPQDPQCRVQQEGYWQLGLALLQRYARTSETVHHFRCDSSHQVAGVSLNLTWFPYTFYAHLIRTLMIYVCLWQRPSSHDSSAQDSSTMTL